MKNIILTGDRPTGKLHLGHYVGSLKSRVELQNNGNYDKFYVMVADMQALTDNFDNPKKIRDNVIEVVLDYLSVGLDPNKITFFVQSGVKALPEIMMYYMNLVTLSRLMRNPTVKSEAGLKDMENTIPTGFLNYPISQAADITAFKANIVPVGEDQKPMIEQTNEIVHKFNSIYGDVLVETKAVLPEKENAGRLVGIDGKNKMSKSLNNCIYLSDSIDEVNKKVMMMYTDPDHIKITDPGKILGNVVFYYLDIFAKDEDFVKYLPEYKNLDELKKMYQQGGVGDTTIKKLLANILNEMLEPIREKRKYYENNINLVYDIIENGTKIANEDANITLEEMKKAIGLDYFNEDFKKEINEKY